jgi:hypothetical protein
MNEQDLDGSAPATIWPCRIDIGAGSSIVADGAPHLVEEQEVAGLAEMHVTTGEVLVDGRVGGLAEEGANPSMNRAPCEAATIESASPGCCCGRPP